MKEPLSKSFGSAFTQNSKQRGAAYQRAGKVDIKRGDAWLVDARVHGHEWYKIEIAIEDEGLFTSCTCPYYQTEREPCKHIWATILEAEELGLLMGDDEPILPRIIMDDDDVLEYYRGYWEWETEQTQHQRKRKGTPAPQKPAAPTWERHLTHLTTQLQNAPARPVDAWPTDRELFYVIDVLASRNAQTLVIEVCGRDRLASGEWGKFKQIKVTQRQITALPDAADRRVIAELIGARNDSYGYYNNYNYNNNYYGYTPPDPGQTTYHLSETMQPILLPDICGTGRLLLRVDHGHADPELMPTLVWDEGEPWQFHLVVSRPEKNGPYLLTGELRRGEEQMSIRDPLILSSSGIAVTHQSVLRFHDDDAFGWISHLRLNGDITVPADQADRFIERLMTMTPLPRLSVPEEMQYEEVDATPRPVLRLAQKKMQQWGPEKLVGDLSFEYEDIEIADSYAGRGVYHHQTKRLLVRDREVEEGAVRHLSELGFKERKGNYGHPSYRELTPKKLPRIVQQLTNDGWRVEAGGKLYRTAMSSSIQVKSGIDWFELHGTVDFGGISAQLPALLAALRKGENTVLLDDGTFGLLPEEWLAKIGAVAGMGKAEEDHMRFNRAQVGLLDALLMAQPEADVDATFQHAREELMSFKGIEPMDPPEEFTGTLRPYQREGLGWLHFLRRFGFGGCLADSMGLGKCVAADTLIAVNGNYVRADELWEACSGTTVFDGEGYWSEPSRQLITNSIDESSSRIVQSHVRHLYRQRVHERMRRITLEDGSSITITQAHKLLTNNGWACEFKVGDYICVPSMAQWSGEVEDADVVKLLAWQIAEGYDLHDRATTRISQNDVSVLEELRQSTARIAQKYGINVHQPAIYHYNNQTPYLSINSRDYRSLLELKGYVWGKTSHEKSIPPCIMQSNLESVRIFLKNYFDAEGSVSERLKYVEISSASSILMQQLALLLRRFGIWLRISPKRKCATNGTGIFRTYYIGTFGGNSLRRFYEEIGFSVTAKQRRLRNIYQIVSNTNVEGIPASSLIADVVATTKLPCTHLGLRSNVYINGTQQFSQSSLQQVIQSIESILSGEAEHRYRQLKPSKWTTKTLQAYAELDRHELLVARDAAQHLLNQQVWYCRIKSIEEVDYDGWVYDFEIADHHNFVANGILCHNTIQVLALLEARRQEREERERQIVMAEEKPKGTTKKPAKKGKKKAEEKQAVPERIGPSLAVVPKSLIFNWIKEAERFTPDLRVLDHTGNQRLKTTEHFEDYDLILTTYGTLRKDVADMKDVRFDYAILDEAQAIKNPSTESAKAARLINADHHLALSGTPVENHLGELWSIFDFLNPGLLGSTPLLKGTANAARLLDEESLTILRQALRPFILRRTKEQVAKDLPPKLEQTIYCELGPKQRKQYDELRAHYRDSLLGMIDERGMNRSKIQVLEALLRLRQAACHPGLIDKKKVRESSAKLDVLMEQIEEVIDGGSKALIFSQFTTLLGIVRQQLDKARIPYEYLDGKTRDRQARVDHFQSDDDCKLFLISLKAGGVGLNLTAADHVFLLDPWWNPAVEAQAIDRTHRIGQQRQVFARRIIARDTVEEKVLELQKTKRDLADAIITADNSLIRNLGREDLEMLLS